MANLSDIKSDKLGILAPLIKYQFRILFELSLLSKEAQNALTMSITNFRTDFVNKTIAFDIQQPSSLPELITVVETFTSFPGNITVEYLDGQSDKVVGSLHYRFLETLKHDFDLDYAESGVATHKIIMKFRSLSDE